MTEQYKYHTITEDIKSLIQYVQHYAIKHPVIEAANRLNKAIKKGLRDYSIPVTPIKESKDSFEEEKLQYAEDSRAHEKPWELWQWQIRGCTTWSPLLGDDHMWLQDRRYRRKPTTFIPEYFSGLNWKDAEGLIGKIIESTVCPSQGWKIGRLTKVHDGKKGSCLFEVYDREDGTSAMYEYIRTVKEILVPEHPTINVCGVELPMPETVAPSNGEQYWLSQAGGEPGYILFWNNDDDDISALKECRIHLTKERAQAWADWWKKEVIAKIKEIVS